MSIVCSVAHECGRAYGDLTGFHRERTKVAAGKAPKGLFPMPITATRLLYLAFPCARPVRNARFAAHA